MIKKLAIAQLIFFIIIYVILTINYTDAMATSFAFSSGLLWLNLLGLAFLWKIVTAFHKPGLATFIGLIKYPIIGLSIFWAAKQPWINPLGITIGVCAFLISIVLTVLLNRIGEKPK
jgi:hypothetical protein